MANKPNDDGIKINPKIHNAVDGAKTVNINGAKQRLSDEKDRLLELISRHEETGIDNTMSFSIGELSMYDNHPADIGDELFERSKDIALMDNEHVLLERVENALDKIENGSYGICEDCGKKIDLERLEALPLATKCIECQREEDVLDVTPRPIEEELLAPPFHRTFLDTANFDNVGFDGEDALQAVMKFGSSDTPQDIPGTFKYDDVWPNSNEHPGIVEYSDLIPADIDGSKIDLDEREIKEKLKNKT